jgi:hypothetical protein
MDQFCFYPIAINDACLKLQIFSCRPYMNNERNRPIIPKTPTRTFHQTDVIRGFNSFVTLIKWIQLNAGRSSRQITRRVSAIHLPLVTSSLAVTSDNKNYVKDSGNFVSTGINNTRCQPYSVAKNILYNLFKSFNTALRFCGMKEIKISQCFYL